MKRGFTLIELLAVIVILAIIALIATPTVLNIINETKDSATLRSAEFYLDAVEQSILLAELNNRRIADGTYNINNGALCLNDNCTDKLEVEIKGERPGSGEISIQNGKIEDIDITLGDNRVVLNDNKDVIHFPCTLISGKANEIGSKYTCEVKPGTKYNFYVLSKEEETINLIMERNICEDGTLATVENTCYVAWISSSTYGCGRDESYCALNDKGPITAMTHLHKATKDWTNVLNMIMNYIDENIDNSTQEKGTTGYGSIKTTNNITTIIDKDGNIASTYTNLKARLPKYSELYEIDQWGKYNGHCPLWLVDYLHSSSYYSVDNGKTNVPGIYGYWTLSSGAGNSNGVQHMTNNGIFVSINSDVARVIGVRPVINIKL